MRLAVAVFLVTAGFLAIFMLANLRETNWSNVKWGVIAMMLLGPHVCSRHSHGSSSPPRMRDLIGG